MPNRRIVVFAGTSADGFIARPDGDIAWLTSRPKLDGFYGIGEFTASIDTKILGRKTYEKSLAMGARFDAKTRCYVFSTQAAPGAHPEGVEFVSEPIAAFARRLRAADGKDIWMMGGGGIIASFLDAKTSTCAAHAPVEPPVRRRRRAAEVRSRTGCARTRVAQVRQSPSGRAERRGRGLLVLRRQHLPPPRFRARR